MTGELRFDAYTVEKDGKNVRRVSQLFSNLPLIAAELLAAMDAGEFARAIEGQGWVGASPAWLGFAPTVIVPHGELLDSHHIEYMAQAIQ